MKAWLIVDGKPKTLGKIVPGREVQQFPGAGNPGRSLALFEGDVGSIRPEELLGHQDVQGFAVYRHEDAARAACDVLAETYRG